MAKLIRYADYFCIILDIFCKPSSKYICFALDAHACIHAFIVCFMCVRNVLFVVPSAAKASPASSQPLSRIDNTIPSTLLIGLFPDGNEGNPDEAAGSRVVLVSCYLADGKNTST